MFNKEMLDKLAVLKNEAEESKARLESIEISEDAGGGLVRVTMNGNRKLKGIEINADLSSIDKSDLEDLLSVAFGRAIERVNELNESEVMSSARSLFPGM